MPILLLAQGDVESREIVRRAFRARYGVGSPSFDTLHIDYKGRTRAKVGPIAAWIPLDYAVYFRFPFMARWDYTAHTAGVQLSGSANAFDGSTFRYRKGSDLIAHNDESTVAAIKAQIWAMMVMLLTPLSDPDVHLRAVNSHTFTATHKTLNSTATICLNGDHTINSIQVHCLNVFSGRDQMLRYDFAEDQHMVNDLILPGKFVQLWDSEPVLEITPSAVRINDPIDDAMFRLEG